MNRLGRRNKTRWIKLMKRRGYKWFGGKLWQKFAWNLLAIGDVVLRSEED